MAFSLKRHRASLAYRLLQEVQARGGMTFGECQAFAFANRRMAPEKLLSDFASGANPTLHPDDLLPELGRTMSKGWWCGQLADNSGRPGILRTHCVLGDDRRYRVVEDLDTPFWHVTPTYERNERERKAKWDAFVKTWAKCPGCGQKQHPRQTEPTNDGQGHITCWGGEYKADCKGRVWLRPEGSRALGRDASSKLDRLTSVQDRKDVGWLKAREGYNDAAIRAYLSTRLV